MRGRADRRHQRLRARARARRQLRWLFADDPAPIAAGMVARRAVDRVPCSCWMCGNPRRAFGGVTRQESRAAWSRDGGDG